MRHLALAAILGVFFTTIYFLDTDAWADNATVKKDEAPKADGKQVVVPTEAEFMKVIADKCVRCHKKPCATVDALKKSKWVIPGKPENSPAYKVIGKHKKAGATYHNLTDAEKKILNDFIKNMK